MGLAGDELVRPIVGGILRSAPWTHAFLHSRPNTTSSVVTFPAAPWCA